MAGPYLFNTRRMRLFKKSRIAWNRFIVRRSSEAPVDVADTTTAQSYQLRYRVEICHDISVIIGSSDDGKKYVDPDIEMSGDEVTVSLITF